MVRGGRRTADTRVPAESSAGAILDLVRRVVEIPRAVRAADESRQAGAGADFESGDRADSGDANRGAVFVGASVDSAQPAECRLASDCVGVRIRGSGLCSIPRLAAGAGCYPSEQT